MEKVYKLVKPKIEYMIFEAKEGKDYRVVKLVTFKRKETHYELARCRSHESAKKWLANYFEELDKELEEENWNEIKESYIGFEGSRD